MLALLVLSFGADPTFTGVNKCPDVPAFAGVNKCPVAKPAVKFTPLRGYPIRGNLWTHPGEIHAHLKSGEHRGKWPSDWVDTLTNLEAESLHSDDHEKKVQWRYIYEREILTPPAPPVQATIVLPESLASIPAAKSVCPSGNCPQQSSRRGLFGWR